MKKPDPERIDEDNADRKREDMQKASRREFQEVLAFGKRHAKERGLKPSDVARAIAEASPREQGLDPTRMLTGLFTNTASLAFPASGYSGPRNLDQAIS